MNGSPIPVLLVSPSATAGGAERALAGLARHLPPIGFRPVVALLARGSAEAWLEDAGCEVEIVPGGECPAAAVASIRQIAARVGAKVVVSNKQQGHLVGGKAAVEAGIPAIWWQHDIAQIIPADMETASVPAAVVVCGSDHAIEAQRRLTPQAPIVKIHSGAAVEEIAARRGSGADIRSSLDWTDRKIIGIVGRLDPWKGQVTFLRAARLIADRRPDVRFAVVGGALIGYEGSYPDDLLALAAELGLAGDVHFAGHQDDVYPWFDALDVAVHASQGEPFGLVVVEAMALGTPVVASTPGGPAEIVEHRRSGLLVPANAEEPLAAAILEILDDPALAARLSVNGQRRVKLFTERRMAERFGSLIREVLAGRRVSLP